ncbi:MAG: peptidoglycan DD-metalloendopeptidase family protein [Patescibacteria group bacterium]
MLSIARKKLTWATIATLIPVVFLTMMISGTAASRGDDFSLDVRQSIFGGPGKSPVSPEAEISLVANYTLGAAESITEEDPVSFETSDGSLAVQTTSGGSLTTRDGLTIYRAIKGETLSKVAANFGVSLNTILWANPSLKGKALKAGDEMIILPVSGVLHRAEEGETVTGIAVLYGISEAEITSVSSRPSDEPLKEGDTIVVPGGKPRRVLGAEANLPNIPGYFAIPAAGWNWGVLHPKNAVDISNTCGTPVAAAAEGLVVAADSPADWNEGYGGFIEIEHPNGTATRYGHLNKVAVTVGSYVARLEKIGEIGNTGNVTGPTGCHLHFEVRGAKNPLTR